MEINKIEVKVLEVVAAQAAAAEMHQLDELQLAYVGGGNASVDFA